MGVRVADMVVVGMIDDIGVVGSVVAVENTVVKLAFLGFGKLVLKGFQDASLVIHIWDDQMNSWGLLDKNQ